MKLSGKALQNIALGQAFFAFDLEAQTTAATLTNGITSKAAQQWRQPKELRTADRGGNVNQLITQPERIVKWTNLKHSNVQNHENCLPKSI